MAPLRELRTLDLAWVLPFSHLRHAGSHAVQFASHLLGHEGAGCLAAALKDAGLVTALCSRVGDHCARPPGFTLLHCELELTEAGTHEVPGAEAGRAGGARERVGCRTVEAACRRWRR